VRVMLTYPPPHVVRCHARAHLLHTHLAHTHTHTHTTSTSPA
jgi:hypothetical protein